MLLSVRVILIIELRLIVAFGRARGADHRTGERREHDQ